MVEQWISEETFGRGKSFSWLIDEENNISIKRYFKNSPNGVETLFKKEQLELLNKYISDSFFVDLANNVEKLTSMTEKEGVGKFYLVNSNGLRQIARLPGTLQ